MDFKANLLSSLAMHAAAICMLAAAGMAGSRREPEEIQIPVFFEAVEAAASSQEAAPPGRAENVREEQVENVLEEMEEDSPRQEENASEMDDVPQMENVPDLPPLDENADFVEQMPDAGPMEEYEPAEDDTPEDTSEEPVRENPAGWESMESPPEEDIPVEQEDRAKVAAGPSALGRIVPVYPRSARRRGHEGRVTVEVRIAGDGALDRAEVIVSSGYPELDESAVTAVKSARFAPATENGVRVNGLLRPTFDFKLE